MQSKRAQSNHLLLLSLLCLGIGCGSPTTDSPPADLVTPAEPTLSHAAIRVLVIDDPSLAGGIEREWSARAEVPLVVVPSTTAELLSLKRAPSADILLYPSSLVGELATRRWILPLPESLLSPEDWDRADVFPLTRLVETVWGDQTVAVPCGSPQWVLAYHAEEFQRRGLQPPQSWDECHSLVEKLKPPPTREAAAATPDRPWVAVAQPLADGCAGWLLLARAAAYVRDRSQLSSLFNVRTMEPLLATPPYERALDELIAAARWGPPYAERLTVADVRSMFHRGECGLAFCWPTPTVGRMADAEFPFTIGYAELPGAREFYRFQSGAWTPREETESTRVTVLGGAGRLASLARGARDKQAACQVLAWLSRGDASSAITASSPETTLFRESQTATPGVWCEASVGQAAAQQYVDVVRTGQSRTLWLSAPRLPGAQRYMRALDRGVQSAVRGDQSAAEALQAVTREWQQITDQLGRDAQRDAYRLSLGLGTSPSP